LIRHNVHSRWFGSPSHEWDGKCTIYLYANLRLYVKETGQPDSLAHARVSMQDGYLRRRSIHLNGDVPALFEDVLSHEITHSVMASQFNGQTPRWADEGMAVLSESSTSIEKWREHLVTFWHKDELFGLEVLMRTEKPRQTHSWEYYAQSMSLVEL